MKYKSITAPDGLYSSFPSVTSSGGRLHVVFRVAGKETVKAAREGSPVHHDVDSAVFYTESRDNGETWCIPREIYRDRFGVNDPGISTLADGTLIVRITLIDVCASHSRSRLKGNLLAHRVDRSTVSSVAGHRIITSRNFGASWDLLSDDDICPSFVSREPIVVLPDDSWILSGYISSPYRTEYSVLVRSFDNGLSWSDMAVIASDPLGFDSCYRGLNYNETCVLPLNDGSMVAIIRTDSSYFTNDQTDFMSVGGVGTLRVSHSFNAGLSWSPPVDSGIWGQPASAVCYGGSIYVVYARRTLPYVVACRKSTDNGVTWGAELVIRSGLEFWDFGYPSVAVTDSQLVVAYYVPNTDGSRYIEIAVLDVELI